MQVYTFSSGGCRDGYYLDKLSTTKEGVKKLLKEDLEEWYLDSAQTIRDIFIDDKLITVVIDDLDIESSFKKTFELVSFNCL